MVVANSAVSRQGATHQYNNALSALGVPTIETQQDLAALRPGVATTMAQRLAMQETATRLLPVEMRDGTVAIFAAPGFVGSDHADALEARLLDCGYRLANPSRYIVAAPLLLALSRGHEALSTNGGMQASSALTVQDNALGDVFQEVLDWAVAHGASDIHFNVNLRQMHSEVRFTIGGRYVQPERFRHLSSSMLLDVLSVAWMDVRGGNGAVFDPHAEQQGSLLRMSKDSPYLLRWSSLAAEQGPSVCLRVLDRSEDGAFASLEALGYFPEQVDSIRQAVGIQGGAIVISGAVGAGKSTTLATMLRMIPSHRKVVTIEDPIERLLPGAIQNSISRDLSGDSHHAYTAKLRSLKRAALDDVCLGEIRDRETGLVFSDSVSSGVGVYTTVHAASAAGIVDRLCSSFIGIPRDLLTSPGTLKLLVHQALLPLLCKECALTLSDVRQKPFGREQNWAGWCEALEHALGQDSAGIRWRNPYGCAHCNRNDLPELNGYRGRTVAAELLSPDEIGIVSLAGKDTAKLSPARHSCVIGCAAAQQLEVLEDGYSERQTALTAALRKMLAGQVDPRDVQERFGGFSGNGLPCLPTEGVKA